MSTPRRRGPSHSVMVLVIIAIAVGMGLLFDLLCTQIEYRIYPRKFSEYVEVYSDRYEIPENVVYAMIKTESDFDSGAVSSAGAVGLMQLMPETFDWLGESIIGERLDRGMMYDPETNIRYGICLLYRLYNKYGKWETAFAAYNAGETRVDGWLESDEYSDGDGNLRNIPLEETRNYVKKVSSAVKMYDKLYGSESEIITEAVESGA